MLCQYICNSFGLLGSILTLILYLGYPQIRQFAFKLIFFLSLTTSGYSISILIGPSTDDSKSCQVQAVLISYFSVSSILWLLTIVHSLKIAILQKRSPEQYLKTYLLICFIYPLFTSIIPVFTGTYSRADYLGICWIKPDNSGSIALILFQVWFLSLFCMGLTGYYFVLFHKSTNVIKTNREESTEVIKYFYRLRPFLCVVFATWVLPLIHLIVRIGNEDADFIGLSLFHCISMGLEGIFVLVCFVRDHTVYECLIDTFNGCIPCLMKKSKKSKKFEMNSRA
jgi:hypothetical protein